MTNKLLEEIKNLGYNHDEVLEILKRQKESEGTDVEDNEEDDNEEDDNEEKKEPEGKSKEESEKDKASIDYNKITEKLTDTISKTVSKEIKKQLAILRKEAPEGKREKEPKTPKDTVTKNMFEVIV